MKKSWTQVSRVNSFDATVFVRVALAASFLSAVADRFGIWGSPGYASVAWGNWHFFFNYTATLTGWLVRNPSLTQFLAILATALEIIFALLLLVGYQTRYAALGAGLLLLTFAVFVTLSRSSPKAALDYSIFTASAASFLVASAPRYPLSLDNNLESRKI